MTSDRRLPRDLKAGEEPVVLVIDDDLSMREALTGLFRSVGLRVETFGSTSEFLQSSEREARVHLREHVLRRAGEAEVRS